MMGHNIRFRREIRNKSLNNPCYSLLSIDLLESSQNGAKTRRDKRLSSFTSFSKIFYRGKTMVPFQKNLSFTVFHSAPDKKG